MNTVKTLTRTQFDVVIFGLHNRTPHKEQMFSINAHTHKF